MNRKVNSICDDQKYIIGDAVAELEKLDTKATLICLDDAWARPQRAGQFGVTYKTHPFSADDEPDHDGVTTTDVIDACYEALEEGGWLIADADDWLLPKLTNYLWKTWGDVAENYRGGGYRRVGSVTYVSKSGEPDRSTAGMYLSNGGYSVVFAHKGKTDRKTSTSARQLVEEDDLGELNAFQVTDRSKNTSEYGSTKPISPYKAWIEGLLDPEEREEHLVVPCAGTAPAALGAELLYGKGIKYTCIDSSEKAYGAFEARRESVLEDEARVSSSLESFNSKN